MKVIGIDSVTAEERKKIETALSDKTVEDFKRAINRRGYNFRGAGEKELNVDVFKFVEINFKYITFEIIVSINDNSVRNYEVYSVYLYDNGEIGIGIKEWFDDETYDFNHQFIFEIENAKDYIELKD